MYTTARGTVQVAVANSAGWIEHGEQHPRPLRTRGQLAGIAPGISILGPVVAKRGGHHGRCRAGAYRMSIYELGQWGESRFDGVQVSANTITVPTNAKFKPENFGTAPRSGPSARPIARATFL